MPAKNTTSTSKKLETERTFLTLLTEEDLPAMMDMAREPDTFKYLKKLRVMTEEEYTLFLQDKLRQIRDHKGFHWAVWLKDKPGPHGVDRATGQSTAGSKTGQTAAAGQSGVRISGQPPVFIGAVNLNPVAGTSMMQIGCQLKRDYWRQGFAYELTNRILDFGINEAGLATVYGLFEKENQASRRLLEKLGFVWQETRDAQGIEIHKYPGY
jgi:RimJ/RimL family protein N-acetyltransferase